MKQNYKNIIRYAMERELQGVDFFRQQAEKVNLASAKDMLLRLSEIEMDHYEYLKEQLDHFEQYKKFKEVDFDLDREKNIFEDRSEAEQLDQQMTESMIPDMSVLRTAYLMEKDFAEFYQDAADQSDDENANKLFSTLALWERGHERMFKQEYQRLMDDYMTQPWGG